MKRAPLYALFVADTISLIGNVVAQVAIPWFVLVTTDSPSLTGLTVFFSFLPNVLAGFFGGVIVDRLGYRRMSLVADIASSVAVAAIPVIHATVGIELWQLMVLVFIGALLDMPGATARHALVPDLAELAGMGMDRANGIRGAIQQSSWLVGAPIGGLLIAGVGATAALWIDAITFLVSAALIAVFAPVGRRSETEPPDRYIVELAEGLRFIWHQRVFRAVMLTVVVTNLLEAPLPVLMPVFAREAFGSAKALGLMYGVLGGTALIGALIFSAIGHRMPRRLTFVCCFAVVPVMYLGMATMPSLPLVLAALAVSGIVSGPINPVLNSVQLELIPPHMRGRVLGAVKAGAWSSIPLGILLGGFLVELVGVAPVFLGIGILLFGVACYGFFNPAFREMDRKRTPLVPSGSDVSATLKP